MYVTGLVCYRFKEFYVYVTGLHVCYRFKVFYMTVTG